VSTDATDDGPGLSLSERVERSPIGQLLISGAIALALLATLGTHLPPSAVAQSVGERANQVMHVLGIEQAWGVFAPDPRSTSLAMEARVTFDDGSTAVWRPPSGDKVVSNLRYYRWRKWVERVRSDDYSNTWDQTARWIADRYDDAPADVVRVDLVRRFRENALDDPQPPYSEYTFFTLDLEGGR
jgi:hypothetical protein